MATIQTFPETKNAPADRYPAQYEMIKTGGRPALVVEIHGDHDAIDVDHYDLDDLVTYKWVEGHGWLTGAMLQLSQRIGG